MIFCIWCHIVPYIPVFILASFFLLHVHVDSSSIFWANAKYVIAIWPKVECYRVSKMTNISVEVLGVFLLFVFWPFLCYRVSVFLSWHYIWEQYLISENFFSLYLFYFMILLHVFWYFEQFIFTWNFIFFPYPACQTIKSPYFHIIFYFLSYQQSK